MNHSEISNLIFDNDFRVDRIMWLAGNVLGFSDDDVFEDVILEVITLTALRAEAELEKRP